MHSMVNLAVASSPRERGCAGRFPSLLPLLLELTNIGRDRKKYGVFFATVFFVAFLFHLAYITHYALFYFWYVFLKACTSCFIYRFLFPWPSSTGVGGPELQRAHF